MIWSLLGQLRAPWIQHGMGLEQAKMTFLVRNLHLKV
jgi:hypothetical protein